MPSGEHHPRSLFEAAKDELRNNPCNAMPVAEPGPGELEVEDIFILAAFDNAFLMTANNVKAREGSFLREGNTGDQKVQDIKNIVRQGRINWSLRQTTNDQEPKISTQA